MVIVSTSILLIFCSDLLQEPSENAAEVADARGEKWSTGEIRSMFIFPSCKN